MATAAEVAEFYNKMMTSNWEKQWGEDAHNGYCEPGDPVVTKSNPQGVASDLQNARARMTVEVLKFAGISDDPLKKPRNIIDVGCGLGGTSRYLVKKYGARCCGIDLSPEQIRRAQELTVADGLEDKISFIVGDALNQSLPDGQFDLVLAFDVIDHTPDKLKFISELVRVAAPGATIIITTICHRELSPGEESLTPKEKILLDKICKPQHTVMSCAPSAYVKIAQSLALIDYKMANWSENVTPFWDIINRSHRTWWGLISLLLSGWDNIRWALALPRILEAYNNKLISYNVIACRKPE